MSSEFARKQKFKKVEKPVYVWNINSFFNKKGPIKHIVEINININYQEHRENRN